MLEAANALEFEKAALLRDQVRELKRGPGSDSPRPERKPSRYPSARRRRS
jgi:excinuclease ABC subunit B